ncbi:MAG: hypothetical protein COB24_12100 [Hyphomicrobiales bacterium]|nr:MAG: hypothetical protein COB24_12100 [Hyphomicrobiales bacterium]
MRAGWQAEKQILISNQLINQMCQMAFGSADYSNITLLSGGRSHQNHLVTLKSGIQVVLRVGKNQASLQKQYALSQKLWGKLPVPRFISQVMSANENNHFAFLEFKRGERLANLQQLPTADQAQLAFELGEYLALIHSQAFKTSGEFGISLTVDHAYDMSPKGLIEFVAISLNKAVDNGYISTAQSRSYCAKFEIKIQILNEWQHGNCLIHADLNEDNILHYDGHISAILDWEFTLAGHPAMDFGKFTRTPYINCPIFLENLCDSYYLTHKNLPANWDDIASVVDLISWAEFLSRKNLNPDVKISAIKKFKAILAG